MNHDNWNYVIFIIFLTGQSKKSHNKTARVIILLIFII
jgi:hypothetical protein